MSTYGLDASSKNGPEPSRLNTRHRLTRSITEIGSLPTARLLFSSTPQSQPQLLQLRHGRNNNDDRQIQPAYSTALPGRTSLDLPRTEGATPNMTPNGSRRTSFMLAGGDDVRAVATAPSSRSLSLKTNMVNNMLEEREKTDCRIAGLKKSILDLGTFSTSTTQRLDDTYHTLLEKTVAVQSTLLALKDITELAREVAPTFEREADALAHNVHEQLDARGGFKTQRARIEALQGRIRDGRGRIEELSGRVDVVRETVEGWERRDQEWRDHTRWRLKMIWMVMVTAIVLVSSLLLAVNYALEPGLAENQNGSLISRPSPGYNGHGRVDEGESDPLHILDEL